MFMSESSYSTEQPQPVSDSSKYPTNEPKVYAPHERRRAKKSNKLEQKTDDPEIQPIASLSTDKGRKEYQRRYYQTHKEKAKEYQREYNRTHKKKARIGRGTSNMLASREVVRITYNIDDLQEAPPEKTEKILRQILNRERMFTMDTTESRNKRGQLPIEERSRKVIPAGTVHHIVPNPN
jgi:hypothetical protein